MVKPLIASLALIGALTMAPQSAGAAQQQGICMLVECWFGPSYCASVEYELDFEGVKIPMSVVCYEA